MTRSEKIEAALAKHRANDHRIQPYIESPIKGKTNPSGHACDAAQG